METKHKPCPFCGSEDLNINPGANYVSCRSCETYGPTPKTDPFAMTQRDVQLAIIWDAWDNRGTEKPVSFTPGPWFVRYCDDDSSMCMTVISSKDWGDVNTSSYEYAYGDKNDSVAIVYHQSLPLVGNEPDVADVNAKLIAAAPSMFEVLEALEFSVEDSNVAFKLQHILKTVRRGR